MDGKTRRGAKWDAAGTDNLRILGRFISGRLSSGAVPVEQVPMISVEARTTDTTTHYDIIARLFHWTLSKLAETAHLTLQFGVCLCIALHIGAALHHHFMRHNDVLARMLPRLRRSIW